MHVTRWASDPRCFGAYSYVPAHGKRVRSRRLSWARFWLRKFERSMAMQMLQLLLHTLRCWLRLRRNLECLPDGLQSTNSSANMCRATTTCCACR